MMLTRIALFSALAILFSCSSDVQDVGVQAQSPFEASEITAVRVESIAMNPMWSDIKNVKLMTLKTCLTDKATGAPVAHESFSVSGAAGTQEVRTRMDGCLYWKEEFAFNYLSRQKLFEVERTLTGIGNYEGSLKLNLAMDLWSSEGGSSVIDKSAHFVGRRMVNASQKNLFQTPGFENLYLEKVDIYARNLIHSQKYVEFDLRSVLTPVFQRRDLNGRTIKEPLTAGVFDLDLWLLERRPGDNRFKILSRTSQTARVKNGLLDNTANMRVESRPKMGSELLVGLRLRPVNAPKGLKGITGFVSFQDMRSVSDIRPLESNLEELLYEGTPKMAGDNFGFRFQENVRAVKGDLSGQAYADSADRAYTTELNFCLVDAFTGKRLREGSSVYVTLKDLDEGKANEQYTRVNHNGCVQVYDKLNYNELATSYKNVQLEVRGAQAPYRDIVAVQNFKIKQWQKSGVVSFHGKAENDNARSAEAKIYAKEMDLTALGKKADGYHLNENMELSITKKYMMEMPLSVIHPNNPAGPRDYASLNFGKYKVTYSMFAPKSERSEFHPAKVRDFSLVHHAVIDPENAHVENGMLKAEFGVEIPYFDFGKLVYQNMFVVRIEPVNLDEVAASTFYGKAILSKGTAKVRLTRLSDEEKDLADVNVQYMASMKRKIRPAGSAMTVTMFKNDLKKKHRKNRDSEFESFYLNSFNQAYDWDLTRRQIQKIDPNSKGQLARFCDMFYQEFVAKSSDDGYYYRGKGFGISGSEKKVRSRVHTMCANNPSSMVKVTKTKHIQKLLSNPELVNGGSGTITSGNAYFISDGNQRAMDEGTRKSFARFMEARSGLTIGKRFPLSGTIEGGVKWSTETYALERDSRVLNDMDRSFTNFDKRLNVEQWTLGFDAEVRNCLLIEAKVPNRNDELKRTKSIHVCSNSNDTEYVTESWAMVSEQEPARSLVVDSRGAKENQFTQLIRGEKSFRKLIRTLEDDNKITVMAKVKNFDMGDHFSQIAKQGASVDNAGLAIDNAFPGLVN